MSINSLKLNKNACRTYLVSRPINTRGVHDGLMLYSETMSKRNVHKSRVSRMFDNSVASPSHELSNISPRGSMSFTPLSSCGLCEAVIMIPTAADFKYIDRKATNMPMRCMT